MTLSVCFYPKLLPPWQCDVTTSPLYTVNKGPKLKFGRYDEVAILTRVSLQENVWSFLPGGQTKVAVITTGSPGVVCVNNMDKMG